MSDQAAAGTPDPPDRARRPWHRGLQLHDSVFARLMSVMAAMTATLLIVVGVFIWFVARPVLGWPLDRVLEEHARLIAETSPDLSAAHATLLSLLLLLFASIVAIVLVTHRVLRRLLQPLQVLNEGVARVGAGDLDVRLPHESRDEFGRLTTAFNQMVGRVREMIAARDRLLIDVSHELRSPLTRMKVALELIVESEQRTGMAADIADMERLISQLLALERLRSGRIKRIRQDLVPILADVSRTFNDRPPGVRIVSAPQEVQVAVDHDMVRMLFRNLLESATKYSLPTSRPVEISVAHHPDAVVIRVTDDGIGVPERDRERIFEPFFRVDRSRSKDTGGYGLGLSICKRVLESHRGSIAVERGAAPGTTLVLTFPTAGIAEAL